MEEFIVNLRNNHSDFSKGTLDDKVKATDPTLLFQKWYKEAYEKNCPEPHAMVLSTVNNNAHPSSRVVYMKELLEEGFVFYTNYESQKGKELIENPTVSLLFYWDCLERQVRISGIAEKTPNELSDDYFASRPKGSQIGAWASRQSQTIPSRTALERSFQIIKERYKGKEIPRPSFWGGVLVKPTFFEFWQGRPNRLHDRICFKKASCENTWIVERKNP